MEKEIQETQDFIQYISNQAHLFIKEYISEDWIVQVCAKFAFLLLLTLVVDLLLKFLVDTFFKLFIGDRYTTLKSLHTAKITHSVAHLISLSITSIGINSLFQYHHPQTFTIFERLVDAGFTIILGNCFLRILKAIQYYYEYKKDFYSLVALRALVQYIRTFGVFIFIVILVSVIFGISATTILGSLGAFIAIIFVVFRDIILGFITGIHVATSKNLKVGDWIGISKYNLEGTILEINLITTKIQNFDKTISTIPTYDLLSTEVKNLQVMAEGNKRRIKKPIVFNVNSFKFIDKKLFEKLKTINLISDYMEEKSVYYNTDNECETIMLNGQQLTNIGVFRRYALNYLKQNKEVDQNETIVVRQLDVTAQGMPLEIYCFANKTALLDYEDIQADIFDHLLACSQIFDLEIMQYNR